MGIYGHKFDSLLKLQYNTISEQTFGISSVVYDEYMNRCSLLESCTDQDRTILEAQIQILQEMSIKDIWYKIKEFWQKVKKIVKEIWDKIFDVIFKKISSIQKKDNKGKDSTNNKYKNNPERDKEYCEKFLNLNLQTPSYSFLDGRSISGGSLEGITLNHLKSIKEIVDNLCDTIIDNVDVKPGYYNLDKQYENEKDKLNHEIEKIKSVKVIYNDMELDSQISDPRKLYDLIYNKYDKCSVAIFNKDLDTIKKSRDIIDNMVSTVDQAISQIDKIVQSRDTTVGDAPLAALSANFNKAKNDKNLKEISYLKDAMNMIKQAASEIERISLEIEKAGVYIDRSLDKVNDIYDKWVGIVDIE